MSELAPRYALLADFANEQSSDGRRELLRKVTDAIGRGDNDHELSGLDEVLSRVAADYSVAVRAELAKLVAQTGQLTQSAQIFALDDIAIAAPVLARSKVVSDATLLKVIASNSQPHMLAVTRRAAISAPVSSALVESGNDDVVVSLLENSGARISPLTYEAVLQRAQTSDALQAPLIRRQDVPVEFLNELYLQVEAGLRREITAKLNTVPADEIDKAFLRSRHRVTRKTSGLPEDFAAAQKRIADLVRTGNFPPSILVSLMREGPVGRTAFHLAFARLTDVEFELVQRATMTRDFDTLALLCRGAGFDKALYVSLVIGLKNPDDRGNLSPEATGKAYEAVPVLAAQRALRFWKARAAA